MTHNCLTQKGFPVMYTFTKQKDNKVVATGICLNEINIGDEFIPTRATSDNDSNIYKYFVSEVIERRKPLGRHPIEVLEKDSFYKVLLDRTVNNR